MLPYGKDWYQSDALFANAVIRLMPKDSHVLELGVGRSSVSALIAGSRLTASLLSTDISPLIVSENCMRFPELSFVVADSLDLRLPPDKGPFMWSLRRRAS